MFGCTCYHLPETLASVYLINESTYSVKLIGKLLLIEFDLLHVVLEVINESHEDIDL